MVILITCINYKLKVTITEGPAKDITKSTCSFEIFDEYNIDMDTHYKVHPWSLFLLLHTFPTMLIRMLLYNSCKL